MRLGYNTNGLAHHRLTDAIELARQFTLYSESLYLALARRFHRSLARVAAA